MKHFIDTPTGEIFAYPVDGSQDGFIKPELVPISDEALAVLRAPTAEQLRAQAKDARANAVANIKVTTASGHTFDGDEISQGRMARANIALQASGTPSVTWVLANNTTLAATAAELVEALALAGAAQAAIWVIQ